MTLNEYMTEADENTIYFIGSKSSFICIVKKNEYTEHIKKWDEIYKNSYAERVTTKFKESIKEQPVYTTYKDQRVTQLYGLTTELDDYRTAKERSLRQFERALERLLAFEPFGIREVTETYNRTQGGVAVSITGFEDGDFWLEEEYVRWKENGALPNGE